jgi:hypothetical protein
MSATFPAARDLHPPGRLQVSLDRQRAGPGPRGVTVTDDTGPTANYDSLVG